MEGTRENANNGEIFVSYNCTKWYLCFYRGLERILNFIKTPGTHFVIAYKSVDRYRSCIHKQPFSTELLKGYWIAML